MSKTSSRRVQVRNDRRQKFAKKIGRFETLEKRLVMASNVLSGTGFIDANTNGQLDLGESFLRDATIELRSADGSSIISTQNTDSSGGYQFTDVNAGNYKLVNRSATSYAGSATQILSDASTYTGSTVNTVDVTVRAPADISVNVNFANVAAAKIGDYVWHDLNASGRQEGTEPGIEGAIVKLYQGTTLVDTATTNSSGAYQFDHLLAGTYRVEFETPATFERSSPTQRGLDFEDSDGPIVNVTLTAGQINNTIDQGFYKLAKLGDFVWNDRNGNGRQASDEEGIENARVNLRKDGSIFDTTFTDSNGRYQFRNLEPGVYDLEFIRPDAYAFDSPQGFENKDDDSDGPLFFDLNLESGENDTSFDQGFYGSGRVGNFVWHDLNANGIQESNEPGIDDVNVALVRGSTQVATTTTKGGGFYSFPAAPGTYTVNFTQPSGYTNLSPTDVGTNDEIDSDGLSAGPVTVVSNFTYNSFDVGFYNLATIGDYVWNDANTNGIQDSNELGIEGATVTLLLPDNTVVQTKQTDSSGLYSFSVKPGTYKVKFAIPDGYGRPSPADATNDLQDSDGLTVGLDIITPTITVKSGEKNNSVDQGFYKLAKIGNFVWNDLDADGIQDTGEGGIKNIAVTLSQGPTFIASTTTDDGGYYSFEVPAGTYTVTFTKPADAFLSPIDVGDDNLDSDGLTSTVTVVPDETNFKIDLGLFFNATIGNYVWNDIDADGVQDSTEQGIDGAVVTLMKGPNVVATTTTIGGGLYSFITAPGDYTVTFSLPADYTEFSPANLTNDELDSDGPTVAVTVVSGQINNSIDQGFYNVTTNACVVIDMQGNSATTGTNGNVRTFGAGSVSVNASAFSRTPAGAWSTAYLGAYGGGLGVTDASEDGSGTSHTVDNSGNLNYVLFEFSQSVLVDSAFLGYVVGDSDMTVWIGNVPNAFASHQTLSDTFLNSLGFTEINATTLADPRTADINAGGIRGNILVIAAQVDNSTPVDNFKIANLTVCVPVTSGNASIGDFVWQDVNGNGLQESTEPGISGATVTLIGGGPDRLINGVGDTTTTATTDSAGKYNFASLLPGTQYKVTFTVPTGYDAATTRKVGTNTSLDSDGLTSDTIVLGWAEKNTSIDAGFFKNAKISNFVWNDLNADGRQDPGEPGIDAVTVTLLQGATQVATTQTAGGGLYSFNVSPGTYTVRFTQPTTYNSVSLANATSDDLDSDGPIVTVTVVSGENNNTVDQGFYNATATACVAIDMQGNSATSGSYGNVRTFSAGGVSVNASAFSRNPAGAWSTAYLGSYGGGLGVTDANEDGSGATHTVDNSGNLNYVLFEFSQSVLVDSAFLGYVVTDSDMTVWIGNVPNAFTSHQTLSDAFLTSLGFTEINTTTLNSARTADINAGGIRGNILVIAAQVDDTTPEDNFKIANLTVCVPVPAGNASIGDFVWHDVNGNGLQETTEPGIQGATVTLIGGGPDKLINGVGDTTTTTTTDSAGKYNFAGLLPGTQYKVNFSVPAGYDAATARRVGTNTGLDSDGLASDVIVLASGEKNISIDAGFYKFVKVGNYIWNDLDRDGLQEYGEIGIPGVQVNLTGTSGSGASISQSTTTAANGTYQFSTLAPGTYTVTVAASNFTAGSVLANYTASPTGAGTDRGLDSNSQPAATVPATLTSGGGDLTVDFGYYTTTSLVCVTMKMEGNTPTYGSMGNIRTFSAGGISVKASAFARDDWGNWSTAYLGSFGGGLGVTDNSEGAGNGNTHTLDNAGRRNYILFEFSQMVTIDSAFLGYVIGDSDLTAWIGTTTDPFNNHRNLNDGYLTGLGYSENNDTTLTTSRTADLNAGNRAGNVLVIAASMSNTRDDYFKVAELTLCATVPTSMATTKFFVVDDDTDRTFKYTSSVQYTSTFGVGTTMPTGIAANPAGTNTWVSDVNGRIFKYDNNGVLNSAWNTNVTGTQGVSTNGTSIWTVSSTTDRVYFYSGAAGFVPSGGVPNATLSFSFPLLSINSNPKDLATDGTTIWVVDDGAIDMVYAYSTSGTYLGRWQLDAANAKPTGITIDPTGGSKIWIVDAGNDRVYEYSGATGCRSGGMLAAKSYPLHAGLGNTNPQGIADPPTADDSGTTLTEALAASMLVDGSQVNPDVNPYHNLFNESDVNDDGVVTAMDALVIINRLNSGTAGKLSIDAVASGERLDFADVNNDGQVSPLDALLVINRLNQGIVATGQPPQEPEAADKPTSSLAVDAVFGNSSTAAEGELSAADYFFATDINEMRRRR